MVRWMVGRINGSLRKKVENDLSDWFHSGRPTTAVNGDKVKQADVLITTDRRITSAKHRESI